eukprot:Skav213577  [mRNA]  locus=scaffold1790:188340:192216:- [translate_table: standard]
MVSEPQVKADLAQSDWGISYGIIGSQDVSLVKHLEEQKIIDLVISEHKDKETYPNGMVQPGLLFIRRSDRAVLFRWAVRPDSSFTEFASYRPTPADVWAAVSAKLTAPVSQLPVSSEQMGIDGIGKLFFRSWCSCFVLRQWGKDGFKELENLKRICVPQEFVADMQRPLSVTLEQIAEEAVDYAECRAWRAQLLDIHRVWQCCGAVV